MYGHRTHPLGSLHIINFVESQSNNLIVGMINQTMNLPGPAQRTFSALCALETQQTDPPTIIDEAFTSYPPNIAPHEHIYQQTIGLAHAEIATKTRILTN
jgi:hypothetical protein